MAVTEGNLAVGETGEKLGTTIVTQLDGTEAHREEVVVVDPEILAARAGVAEDAAVKEAYAARVFDVMGQSLLDAIKEQTLVLKRIERHLSEGSGEAFKDEEMRHDYTQ